DTTSLIKDNLRYTQDDENITNGTTRPPNHARNAHGSESNGSHLPTVCTDSPSGNLRRISTTAGSTSSTTTTAATTATAAAATTESRCPYSRNYRSLTTT
ncbi:unnamed protein product, partial [Owenia fusiformis]